MRLCVSACVRAARVNKCVHERMCARVKQNAHTHIYSHMDEHALTHNERTVGRTCINIIIKNAWANGRASNTTNAQTDELASTHNEREVGLTCINTE